MMHPSRKGLCLCCSSDPILLSPTSNGRCRNRHFLSPMFPSKVLKGLKLLYSNHSEKKMQKNATSIVACVRP